MNFHDKPIDWVLKEFNTDIRNGLDKSNVINNKAKYGENVITAKKEKGLLFSVINAIKEPMLIILLISFAISLGTDIGSALKTGKWDFTECVGILLAIVLSVSITLIMEGSSKKAFKALNSVYDNLTVKVIREGQTVVLNYKSVVAGDIMVIESGDKIVADGRLISSYSLEIDESPLTGESIPVEKDHTLILSENTPLAERKNMVYSGSFVKNGGGLMVVTSVGNKTEMGEIAKELALKKQGESPLTQKLNKLSKTITIIGIIVSAIVFILSLIKLIITKSVTFNAVSGLLISSVILIVAAVPEGLPTIVAVSLALNMIKLAGENALIKKMIATETAGAVSVICTDKTGTLTKNDMKVVGVYGVNGKIKESQEIPIELFDNLICNNLATESVINGKREIVGSATEKALVSHVKVDFLNLREYRKDKNQKVIVPFSSKDKMMISCVDHGNAKRYFIKGAPEVVLEKCEISLERKFKVYNEISKRCKNAERVLCFGHYDGEKTIKGENIKQFIFDGYVCIKDPIRDEVKKAVKDCKTAGIKVKMLTGDNIETARGVAIESGISINGEGVVDASSIEKMDNQALMKALEKITVIARSTPMIKLRVVKALKEKGEVIAVTGDGINDAPAIKQADVGIAMGKAGSEITKESADVILLDDSFSTVVKAVAFGRNVYRNIQRFIVFQLSVNLSALIFIAVCAVLGLKTPFSTLQLLWINVIMDGPPALTLGLQRGSRELMSQPPVKKNSGLLGKKLFFRIAFNGLFVSFFMIWEYLFDFLNAGESKSSVIFSLFILFQLFNAFNCRELGVESIFKSLNQNKIMAITFLLVFIVHLIIVQFFSSLFSVTPMSFALWCKCIALSLSIIIVSEVFKLLLRLCRKGKNEKTDLKIARGINNLKSGA